MAKKAPDPERYWDYQYQQLKRISPTLFATLNELRFQHWDGASISERNWLAKSLVEVLGNPYDYAPGTFVDALRKAKFRLRSCERWETLVKEFRARLYCEFKPCIKRNKFRHNFKTDKLRRGLTASIERRYCESCNSFRWVLLEHCGICKQAMDQLYKPKTLNCGGDCRRCMDEAEGVVT